MPTSPSPIRVARATRTSERSTELNHESVNPSGVIDCEGSLRR